MTSDDQSEEKKAPTEKMYMDQQMIDKNIRKRYLPTDDVIIEQSNEDTKLIMTLGESND